MEPELSVPAPPLGISLHLVLGEMRLGEEVQTGKAAASLSGGGSYLGPGGIWWWLY